VIRERLRDGWHLVRRFFGHVRARPLGPREQATVRKRLEPALADWFFRQHPADQRHAWDVAERTAARRPHDAVAIVAALMHDIGKVDAGLGAVSRSLATIAGALRLPLRGRWLRYREHGRRGAEILEGCNADDLVVAFARHHPGPAPAGIDPVAWADLASADHG
jgi:hypothetical protein